MKTTLILLTIFGILNGDKIPNFYAGGCAIQDETLYYLGGKSTTKDNEFNDNIYKLDLTSFNINNDNSAPWNKLIPSSPLNVTYPNVLPSVLDSNIIMIYGGSNVKMLQSFKELNIKDLTVTINLRASEWSGTTLSPNTTKDNGNDMYSDQRSTWIRSPIDKDISLLYGGYLDNNDLKTRRYGSGKVTKFSERSEEWNYETGDASTGLLVFDHATIGLPNGEMITMGGQAYDQSLYSFKTIFIFDIISSVWKPQDTSGDIPEEGIGHSLVYKNDYIYLIGGALNTTLTKFRNDVYRLDTKTWKWFKISVDGLKTVGYKGCVQQLDSNTVIMSFGLNENDESITQLLDLKEMKMLSSYSIRPRTVGILPILLPIVLLIAIGTAVFLILRKRRNTKRRVHKLRMQNDVDFTTDPQGNVHYDLENKQPEWYEMNQEPVKNKEYL